MGEADLSAAVAASQSAAPVSRLRAYRTALGLTMDELAAKSGVSRRTIFGIEKGEHNPMMPTRKKLLAALRQPLVMHESMFGPLR